MANHVQRGSSQLREIHEHRESSPSLPWGSDVDMPSSSSSSRRAYHRPIFNPIIPTALLNSKSKPPKSECQRSFRDPSEIYDEDAALPFPKAVQLDTRRVIVSRFPDRISNSWISVQLAAYTYPIVVAPKSPTIGEQTKYINDRLVNRGNVQSDLPKSMRANEKITNPNPKKKNVWLLLKY
jgi:hypothetical protein